LHGRKVKGGGKGKEWSGGKVGREKMEEEGRLERKENTFNNFQRADSG